MRSFWHLCLDVFCLLFTSLCFQMERFETRDSPHSMSCQLCNNLYNGFDTDPAILFLLKMREADLYCSVICGFGEWIVWRVLSKTTKLYMQPFSSLWYNKSGWRNGCTQIFYLISESLVSLLEEIWTRPTISVMHHWVGATERSSVFVLVSCVRKWREQAF